MLAAPSGLAMATCKCAPLKATTANNRQPGAQCARLGKSSHRTDSIVGKCENSEPLQPRAMQGSGPERQTDKEAAQASSRKI